VERKFTNNFFSQISFSKLMTQNGSLVTMSSEFPQLLYKLSCYLYILLHAVVLCSKDQTKTNESESLTEERNEK
jgi:hypothetical protein